MTQVSDLPNFSETDLVLVPRVKVPSITDGISKSIAFNMGWSTSLNLWKRFQSDAQGRLLISTAGISTAIVNQTNVSMTNTEAQIVAANLNRTQITLQVTGANPVWIGLLPLLAVGSLFQMQPGAVLTLDNWVGAIFGTCVSTGFTSTIVVLEF